MYAGLCPSRLWHTDDGSSNGHRHLRNVETVVPCLRPQEQKEVNSQTGPPFLKPQTLSLVRSTGHYNGSLCRVLMPTIAYDATYKLEAYASKPTNRKHDRISDKLKQVSILCEVYFDI